MKITIHNDFMRREWVFFLTDDSRNCYSFDESSAQLKQISILPGEELIPLIRLPSGDMVMQSLADSLANAGFMASNSGNAKELNATREHLSDMRAMAKSGFDLAMYFVKKSAPNHKDQGADSK